MKNSRKAYADIVLTLMPRILGSMDRNEYSDTYGCLDRAYWQYKTSDFACARFQEPALTLALLYSNSFDGNIVFENEKTLKWSIASMEYVLRIQNSNGSFDEWYPNEHSYVGTAFPIYSLSEAYLMLEKELTEKQKEEIYECFVKAGKWLMKEKRIETSNQEAGAIAALYNLYLISKELKFKKAAENKVETLTKIRSDEGWFPEYGGPDIGYLTVLIDFLAKYYKKSRDKIIPDLLDPTLSFISYFIHPDGSSGGEYASRNTEFRLPHGFEILSKENEKARAISDKLASSVSEVLNPLTLDDRFSFQYHSSYLQAFLEYEPRTRKLTLPYEKEFSIFFEKSGLMTTRQKKYYAVLGASKGGVLKVFSPTGKLIYSDCGYVGKLSEGEMLTSQWLDLNRDIELNEDEITIRGEFMKVSTKQVLNPSYSILLRTAMITLGRSRRMAKLVKNFLSEKLIKKGERVGMRFVKRIKLNPDNILIHDTISKEAGLKLEALSIGSKFSLSYTPTSRFFQKAELEYELENKDYAKEINEKNKIEVARQINVEAR